MIGNRIQGVTIGVGLTAETGARVAGNDVRAAGAAGIAGSNLAVTAALSGNRLRHCGHAGFIGSLGGSVLILTSLADIVIESCEILDTGIPPEGKRTLGIALGAWLWICLSCRVANNLIAYTDLTTLEPAREDRALVLLGLQSIVFGEQRLAFGSAQVLGNEFIGAGHSALVEFSRISDTVDYRHEKVIYSNNHCLHANGEPSQDRATVRLWGSDLIVTGNHVKAGPRYFSMAFNGRTDVALIANVTTGGFTQLGSAVPMPPGNFNVQI